MQRKFLLLAAPGGDVAAALVEAGKYCYLYRSTAAQQEYGEHQVGRDLGRRHASLARQQAKLLAQPLCCPPQHAMLCRGWRPACSTARAAHLGSKPL